MWWDNSAWYWYQMFYTMVEKKNSNLSKGVKYFPVFPMKGLPPQSPTVATHECHRACWCYAACHGACWCWAPLGAPLNHGGKAACVNPSPKSHLWLFMIQISKQRDEPTYHCTAENRGSGWRRKRNSTNMSNSSRFWREYASFYLCLASDCLSCASQDEAGGRIV